MSRSNEPVFFSAPPTQHAAYGAYQPQPTYQPNPAVMAQPIQYPPVPIQNAQPLTYNNANPGDVNEFDAISPSSNGGMLANGDPSSDNYIGDAAARLNPVSTGWRDKWFLVAFVLHFVGLVTVAGYFGPNLNRAIRNSEKSQTGESGSAAGTVIGLLVVAAAIGVFVSWLWMRMIQHFTGSIIRTCMIINIALGAVIMIVSFAYGLWVNGLFLIFWLIIVGWWFLVIRNRIPFAEATLASSVQSVRDNAGPIYVSYALAVIQLGFLAFWSYTFAAVVYDINSTPANNCSTARQQNNNCDIATSTGPQRFAIVWCVFSLYWVVQVFRNVGHVTTAGMTASWWFTPLLTQPTKGALWRASTTSLGSICFASLIVAILDTIRFIMQQGNNLGFLGAIIRCLLDLLDRFVRWFNKFALVEVAMYGYDFLAAAKATKQLFFAEFWTIIINDNLTSMVFRMGLVISGAISGIICGIWAYEANLEGWVYIAFLAFFIGFLMATFIISVLESSVTTTLVCWAEDPAALQRNRPTEFAALSNAATAHYGQFYQAAFLRQPPQQQPIAQV